MPRRTTHGSSLIRPRYVQIRFLRPCRVPAVADTDLYDPRFVAALSNEMSGTYGLVNVLSSFGFCVLWRRQVLRLVDWRPGDRTIDLMAGMAELLPGILKRAGPDAPVTAVDLSGQMCDLARRHVARRGAPHASVLQADALALDLPDASADVVVSSFGLKTFSPAQIHRLGEEVRRLLRPGGQFAFLEISVPPARLLRLPYLFYLRHVIPHVGRLLLGNPDNYRLLEVYTTAFGDCGQTLSAFRAAGLRTGMTPFFFGCATAVHGERP